MHLLASPRTRTLVALAGIVAAGLSQGCHRRAAESQSVYLDLNKASGKNICPGGMPELPRANADVRLLLETQEFRPGEYRVVVYRSAAGSPQNIGDTGIVTAEEGAAALRVKLRLDTLEPGPYTLSIGASPNVRFCDVQVK